MCVCVHVCVCVSVRVCVCVWFVYVSVCVLTCTQMCVWIHVESEGEVRCFPLLFSTVYSETGFLTESGIILLSEFRAVLASSFQLCGYKCAWLHLVWCGAVLCFV